MPKKITRTRQLSSGNEKKANAVFAVITKALEDTDITVYPSGMEYFWHQEENSEKMLWGTALLNDILPEAQSEEIAEKVYDALCQNHYIYKDDRVTFDFELHYLFYCTDGNDGDINLDFVLVFANEKDETEEEDDEEANPRLPEEFASLEKLAESESYIILKHSHLGIPAAAQDNSLLYLINGFVDAEMPSSDELYSLIEDMLKTGEQPYNGEKYDYSHVFFGLCWGDTIKFYTSFVGKNGADSLFYILGRRGFLSIPGLPEKIELDYTDYGDTAEFSILLKDYLSPAAIKRIDKGRIKCLKKKGLLTAGEILLFINIDLVFSDEIEVLLRFRGCSKDYYDPEDDLNEKVIRPILNYEVADKYRCTIDECINCAGDASEDIGVYFNCYDFPPLIELDDYNKSEFVTQIKNYIRETLTKKFIEEKIIEYLDDSRKKPSSKEKK